MLYNKGSSWFRVKLSEVNRKYHRNREIFIEIRGEIHLIICNKKENIYKKLEKCI